MLDFVKQYGGGQYSQNGEAGIIDECLRRIKPQLKIAVEFGAPNRTFCSNIYHLDDFDKYFYDIDPHDEHVTRKEITAENINDLPNCSVISMDTDGMDYKLWEAYNGRPDVVIIEINSSLSPEVYHWSQEKGCSYALMNKLGEHKGYFLLCHTGNLIFILNEHRGLFPEITLDPIINHQQYFNTSWL